MSRLSNTTMRLLCLCFYAAAFAIHLHAAPPRDALTLDAKDWPQDYRLHLEGGAKVKLSDDLLIPLGPGVHDIAVEHPAKGHPVIRV
jgi:hypothetical protein